jgi:hypothetical protein
VFDDRTKISAYALVELKERREFFKAKVAILTFWVGYLEDKRHSVLVVTVERKVVEGVGSKRANGPCAHLCATVNPQPQLLQTAQYLSKSRLIRLLYSRIVYIFKLESMISGY